MSESNGDKVEIKRGTEVNNSNNHSPLGIAIILLVVFAGLLVTIYLINVIIPANTDSIPAMSTAVQATIAARPSSAIRETVIVPQTVIIKETAQTIIHTVIVKETALPPQKETVIVRETVQVTSSANNSPKLSLPLNPELTPTPKALNLTGNWNWSVQIEKTIDQDGIINRSTGVSVSNWLVRLTQSGTAINGELLGSESGICKALFKGILNGNNLTLEGRAAGNCCANSITKYDLIVSADQGEVTITGDFKPVNPPIRNCTMWWASITGSREN